MGDSGSGIRDLGSGKKRFRIPGSKNLGSGLTSPKVDKNVERNRERDITTLKAATVLLEEIHEIPTLLITSASISLKKEKKSCKMAQFSSEKVSFIPLLLSEYRKLNNASPLV
jgi:hypothetical protein